MAVAALLFLDGEWREVQLVTIHSLLIMVGSTLLRLLLLVLFVTIRRCLTKLMQDSLGGNAKTLMFVNCGPADYNAAETKVRTHARTHARTHTHTSPALGCSWRRTGNHAMHPRLTWLKFAFFSSVSSLIHVGDWLVGCFVGWFEKRGAINALRRGGCRRLSSVTRPCARAFLLFVCCFVLQSSLDFAKRCKNVVNDAKAGVDSKELQQLRKQLAQMKRANGDGKAAGQLPSAPGVKRPKKKKK